MDTKPISNRMQGLLSLFDYHTTFFSKALEGLSEQEMHSRLNTEANHPAWIAGSLVAQRFQMASETGTGQKQTSEHLFKNNKGIEAEAQYPSINEYIHDWKSITPEARQALVMIDDKKLDSNFQMEGMKMTYYELISFTIYREANMIGQLALWRRLLGHSGLRYD